MAHFHMPHIKPPNPSFFFCLSQFRYADTISPYSSRIFVIISASKNYRGTMGGCIDIMPYKKLNSVLITTTTIQKLVLLPAKLKSQEIE